MAEPWFRCHADLATKRVTHRCADALKIDLAAAAGHLVFLWGWFSRNVDEMPNGSLKNISDRQLETAAHWRGKQGAFAAWVRRDHATKGHVNEWGEYNGRLEKHREQARDRQRRRREALSKQPGDRIAEFDDAVIADKSRGRHARVTRDNAVSHVPDVDVDVNVDVNGSSKPSKRVSRAARAKTSTQQFSRIHEAVK